MRELRVTLPQILLIAGTRGLAGLGVGLLIAGHFKAERRTAAGLTLLVVGALSTIPLVWRLLRAPSDAEPRRVGAPAAGAGAAAMMH